MKRLNWKGWQVRLYWAYGAIGLEICRPNFYPGYFVYALKLGWPLLSRYKEGVSTSREKR